jgi:hypothetical protein
VARAGRGTAMSGRSEARAPGRAVPGSGVRAVRRIAARKAPSSSHHTRCVGAGPYWASTLALSAPRARPAVPPLLVTSGARLPAGRRSSSAAPSALAARPTATPCNARAANRAPAPGASTNTRHAAVSAPSAVMIPGRRPA